MEINPTTIQAVLAREYGLHPTAAWEGPRGWAGDTYIVETAEGRVFAKVPPASPYLQAMTAGLPVLEALRAAGLDYLSAPIRTTGGRLTVPLADRHLILFHFIPGTAGDKTPFDFERYVTLLARVHQARVAIPPDVPREQFQLPFAEQYVSLYDQLWQRPDPTAPQVALRQVLQPYAAQIADDWAELVALSETCRQAEWPPLITHSDAMDHNLLVDADGRIAIIDWDELMLGPAERDTWSYVLDGATRAAFLATYRQTFPAYRPDPRFCRFYVRRRFFEDLRDYLIEILERDSLVHQQRNVSELEATCFRWLWPMMRTPSNEQ
jgi:Ser/Thr protein kinase RdoA (MazF antagonist)